MKNRKNVCRRKKINLVYKCLHNSCDLFYDSVLGLRRHISHYDHNLYYNPGYSLKCPVRKCSVSIVKLDNVEFLYDHFEKEHAQRLAAQLRDILVRIKKTYETTKINYLEHNVSDNCVNLSAVMRENDLLKDVLCSVYPSGVIKINDIDKPDLIFCGIPGCGKHFKSVMAYKYHCQTYLHSFATLFDSYCRSRNLDLDYERVKDLLCRKFSIADKFYLEGVTHHSIFSPDQFYTFTFSMDRELYIRKKRHRRNDMNVLEYNNLLEEDISVTDFSDQIDSLPSKIYYRGTKYDVFESFEDKNFKFVNFRSEITAAERYKDYFCVTYRSFNRKESKMFEFYREECRITFFCKRNQVGEFKHSYGFIRKIKFIDVKESFFYLALFNDGFLRYCKNDQVLIKYQQEKVTNFIVLGNFNTDTIVATDGFYLYKFEGPNIIATSTKFEFPIIAIEARITPTKELYLLNANGKVTYCDIDFRDEQEILTHAGITNIIYLKDIDGLLVCDSFMGTTKLVYPGDQKKKTCSLDSNFVCCSENTKKLIVSGTYDGVVTTNSITKKKKICSEKIFEIIRRKEYYVICSEEYELSICKNKPESDFDGAVRIINTFLIDNFMVIAIMSGFVVLLDLKTVKGDKLL
ncbi:putative Zinc finger, C2H2-like protein [Trachipleistophora hominis]|uniref:Putative Zinc finger, C2H2-like protein n=1 Tax=Trachipleistophora hominis TaxID=72359 RepID=L7JS06_TRAHO|nr:putative Zinc finger, C2H2-like protein [Trachipleistophora hominis]